MTLIKPGDPQQRRHSLFSLFHSMDERILVQWVLTRDGEKARANNCVDCVPVPDDQGLVQAEGAAAVQNGGRANTIVYFQPVFWRIFDAIYYR